MYMVKKLKNYLIWYYKLLFVRDPIIIYQMGKVGSSSIRKTLEEVYNKKVIHVHKVNPVNINRLNKERKIYSLPKKHLEKGKIVYHKYFRKVNHHFKIISVVREPISRNISSFFENYKDYFRNIDDLKKRSIDELKHVFLNDFVINNDSNLYYTSELYLTTSINIFKYKFPKEKGWNILKFPNRKIELLLMKLEISDSEKEKALNEFLGRQISLTRTNVGEQKAYSVTYRLFREKVKLPVQYLDYYLNSAFTKYFYTEGEIKKAWRKWAE